MSRVGARYIKRIASYLLAIALIGQVVQAQDRLEPETGVLAEARDEYSEEIRQVFRAAYAADVELRVVVVASFDPEAVVGIRKTEEGFEAFVMTPSSAIADLERVRTYESGQVTVFDRDGKEIPLEKDATFQELKRRTPTDVGKITVQTKVVPIPEPLVKRISKVWEDMLLDVRYPDQDPDFIYIRVDGTKYHFSMWVPARGILSGQTWSPEKQTKTAALVDLAFALRQYANKEVDAKKLAASLKPFE